MLILAAATLAAAPAHAQLGLPDLVGRLPVLDQVDDRLGDLTRDTLDTTRDLLRSPLEAADALDVRALARAHADVLEALPGDTLVVRSEVLALDPTDAALGRAAAAGFLVARERALGGLGSRLVVLAAPPGMTTTEALDALRTLDPGGAYDLNHVYTGSQSRGGGRPARTDAAAAAGPARSGSTIGLIDGGVEADHPALAGAAVVARAFDPHGYAPSAHGTAVASLLAAGRGHDGAARLLVADVYGGSASGGAADSVAAALSWLAEERAPVINISLVGGRNALLDVLLTRTAERGALIVAAAGNDGAAAAPLYPAAHPAVIAVTGVDRRGRALVEAGRGPHVMFAARGADVAVAAPGGGTTRARGTSFAAPVVARALAGLLPRPSPEGARAARETLIAAAQDLGAPGRDPVYGYGLIEDGGPRLLQAAARNETSTENAR